MFTTKDKTHFIREQLKNYHIRKYRLECEMDVIRRATAEIGDEFMKASQLEEKEAEAGRAFKEVNIAIEIYEQKLKELS